MKKYTFSKEERLCSKRLITDLFRHGSSFFIYPYRITFLRTAGLVPPLQVMFSVPKRRFPHAVHRNLIKRRMRESYRLQKSELQQHINAQSATGLVFSIQYVGKELEEYAKIHARMGDVLQKLGEAAP